MATFQVSNKNKSSTKNAKLVTGWVLIFVCSFVFLFSATSIIPFLKTFFLGAFGIFVYPLCVLGFIVSLALLNNKKYVMPKRYAIFLIISLILILSILQLIIIGLPAGKSYGEYIALNYTKRITAGGMLIGFIPSSLMYLMGGVATYIILSIGLIASIAFFVEAVVSLKKTEEKEAPIRFQIKEKEVKKPFNPRKENLEEQNLRNEKVYKAKKPSVPIMLDGNVQEEEKRELSAREKLGLVGNYQMNKPEEKKLVLPKDEDDGKIPEGMTTREYLLHPPKLNMEKYMESVRRTRPNMSPYFKPQNPQPTSNALESEIAKNIDELKNDEPVISSPEPISDEKPSIDGVYGGNLPEIKPEEITSEAEEIIRATLQEEKEEREEEYKNFIDFDDDEPATEKDEHMQSNAPIQNNEEEFDAQTDSVNDSNSLENRQMFDRNGLGRAPSFDRENIARNDRDTFARDERNFTRNDRDGLLRTDRENLDRNAVSSANANNIQRDNLMRRDFNHNDEAEPKEESEFARRRGHDEIDRRKSMVDIPATKEERVVPYKYTRPSIDLIQTKSDDLSMFNEEIPMKRVALENALENFGVPAKVQNVVIGPTVTRYEIEMPEGISVKKVLSLDADIAYALSAKGQIRIEAPIPGRSVVGIEVPNSKVAKVSIKDVLQSKEFTLSPSPLTFALGKDITGNVKVCNLQKMPHLLVAGTTGSGKSVCLNSIITSILYKSSPDEVKFIMIDPKQVELSMYEGLPHMVIPRVITDPTKAVNALGWAVDEMERRFNLISEERVRNIDEYNRTEKVLQNKVKKMPYIVIIFDEFADFMAVAKNEIEDKIRRLAGKARAAGIHLILATQRPSTDVVTGTLKANLPARIAFKVAGRVDSEVIMGATGAEKLLGYGDMLYKPADSAPVRIQGCFIDTPETKEIVNFITANNDEIFDEEAFNAINNPGKNTNGNGGENKDGVDPLLPQALKICIDNGVASSTMVQRKLSIGYPRAARIIDQMEERGYISSAEGSKQRAVYISIEEFYSIFGDIYD